MPDGADPLPPPDLAADGVPAPAAVTGAGHPASADGAGLAGRLRHHLRASPLAARLADGALVSFIGSVLARVLTLAAVVVVGRRLDPQGFGEFSTIQQTAGAFGVFAGLGLGITATRALAQWRSSDPARAGRTLAMVLLTGMGGGTLLGVALALAAPWLAATTLNNPGLAPGLAGAALLLPLGAVAGVQTGALAGLEAFRAIAAAAVIAGVLAFPAMVAGVVLGGRDGAVWGLVGGQLATCVVNQAYLAKDLRRVGIAVAWRSAYREHATLWSFSLPSALASSLVVPMNWVCTILLERHPDGYVQFGLFNAGAQWRQLVMFIPLQVAAVAMPMLTRLHAGGEHAAFRRIAGGVIAANACAAVTLGMVVLLLGPLVLSPFGHAYTVSTATLLPLMAGAVVMTANGVLALALNARGESRSVLAGTFLYALAAVGITASPLGADAVGLATAQLIGSALATVVFSWRLFGRRPAEPR